MPSIRIIGGRWRRRNLTFSSHALIRPTPNRVRETLFNWLAAYVQGANCLDLFAGSGALSFEALSRGAAWCTLVDNCSATCRQIRNQARRLAIKNIEVCTMDAVSFVCRPMRHYDIVFLDPPFSQGLIEQVLGPLSQAMQSHKTLIYMEMGRNESCRLPKNWHCLHHGSTQQTQYRLICNKTSVSC